jgi:hypothetical protein
MNDNGVDRAPLGGRPTAFHEGGIMSSSSRLLVVMLAACVWALPAVADAPGERGLPPEALREALREAYDGLQADPVYQNLREQVSRDAGDPATVDRFLDYLPLSPLEMLRIDMDRRRFEIMIPAEVVSLHHDWMRRHEELARAWYGDATVDRVVGDGESAPVVDDEMPGDRAAKEATVGTNRNLASGGAPDPEEYQGEVQVKVNPGNAQQVIAAANTMGGCPGDNTQAAFYSTDGGVTWGMSCPPSRGSFGFPECNPLGMAGIVIGSDPALWWGDDDTAYLEYMLVCLDFLGGLFSTEFAIVTTRSTDAGATWSPQGTVVNSWGSATIEDKEFYNIDRFPSSPYYGRHYTCWDTNNDEQFAWSADAGATWNRVNLPAAPSGGTDLGCEIAVADDGTVYVVFDSLTCAGSSCTDEEMFVTRSADGGASWTNPVRIRDFNLASFSSDNTPGPQDSRGINPFGAIDVDSSGGACDGTLYVTFSDYVTGTSENTDVWLSRSTDNGVTWSTPLRINDDGEGGRAQFHPTLVVDQSDGSVVVAWQDARNDAANHQVDVYLARSTDCGLSFEPNVQVTAPSAEFANSGISWTNVNTGDNSGANLNQYGEYLGLDVLDGTAYVAWMDSRHYYPTGTSEPEKENVGFATVTFEVLEPLIFADGFESGDMSAWSQASP